MTGTFYHIGSVVLAVAVLWAVISIVYVSWKNGISPMPSSAPVRRAVIFEMNRMTEGERRLIVEAGSGWGTLALDVARNTRGSQFVGIENSSIPLGISKLMARINQQTEVTFIRGDIYNYSYGNVNVVLCYLYPGAMKRLSKILYEQLAPEAIIIAICFALPDWQPERVITCGDLYQTKVYVYRKRSIS
ncbi:class I SAM-dependent methyltransferase [Paenibacillus sp. FA6]|uniref:class I SAM-dependent methyltransferase n=1 Tax=Paenibacillus sp. FA6 TaxID=3413029 RepID=UPI003F6585C8